MRKRGWTKQLHLGALRSNNTRLLKQLGPDTGFDSIGDFPQAQTLAAYLDRLDSENSPAQDHHLQPESGGQLRLRHHDRQFQDGTIPGKIQYGSGWWFLDQKEGMEWQINALSNLGLLSRFIGMITDSRSFMSYPRHEYFRRTLCNLIGRDIENGEMPERRKTGRPMIKNICYTNAKNYLAFPGVK
jgi:glucuronate isomerase